MAPTTTTPVAAPATDPGEPAICIRCQGIGTIEVCTFGVGLHEVRCPGVDDAYDCDGGFIR
jgi:hypothetical protein